MVLAVSTVSTFEVKPWQQQASVTRMEAWLTLEMYCSELAFL
jgi:hypothetical protein